MTILRPIHSKDLDALIEARMDRQLDRRHIFGGEGANLIDLVRLEEPGPSRLPVGLWDGETLVAAFALQSATPQDGWTLEERQEPSLLVSYAHSHPKHKGLGRLVTPWLCDYAARQARPPNWVRCSVRNAQVAWHLRRNCGWQSVREIRDWKTLYLLQLAPKQHLDIHSLIRSEGVLTAREGTSGGMA